MITYVGPPLPFVPGQRIVINSAGAWPGQQGWSIPEPWGTWTVGSSAMLRLKTDHPLPPPTLILIEGHAFLAPKRLSHQEVEVLIDGRPAGTLHYDLVNNEGTRAIPLPAGLGADGDLTIELRIAHPTAPAAPGEVGDKRQLGLGVEAVTVATRQAVAVQSGLGGRVSDFAAGTHPQTPDPEARFSGAVSRIRPHPVLAWFQGSKRRPAQSR